MSAQAVERLRPRDCIRVGMLGPAQFVQLAKLRLYHPGGTPTLEPQTWSGALEGNRVVAALGWSMLEEGVVTVIELDKTDDHWGTVGTMVLIEQFVTNAQLKGLRVQAFVLPANTKLKKMLARIGGKIVLEIWEKVND